MTSRSHCRACKGGMNRSGALSNGVYQLSFGAVNSNSYAVDASADLINWTSLATNTAIGALFQFTDTNPPPQRFYRVRPLH